MTKLRAGKYIGYYKGYAIEVVKHPVVWAWKSVNPVTGELIEEGTAKTKKEAVSKVEASIEWFQD